MPASLESRDIQVLESLTEHGPRNISKVSRELDMPRGTVVSRIKRMTSLFFLNLGTTVYHTNLGLKKAVVFAKAAPGQEDLLFNCLKVNKFYIYLSRCFGPFEGCVGIYVIPVDHTAEFKDFIEEVERMGVAQDIELFWSTCFHTVNLTRTWFDEEKEDWTFRWKEWLEEVMRADDKLPYTLKDPKDFPLRADETDMFIIKELEKDATVSLACIAQKLGTSLQNVRYHYKTHVVKRGLIETFQMAILPFDRATSDMLFFVFKFRDKERMSKFARTLLNKPFVFILGKILNENSLISQIYLPRQEFRNFIDALSSLAAANLIESYEYVFQDLLGGKWSRETIPFEFFKNRAWIYDHSQHVQALHEQASHLKQDVVGVESTKEPVFST